MFNFQDIQTLLGRISMRKIVADKMPDIRQPRMQIVGSGRKLKKSELFQLHDRIVRLQSLMESRKHHLMSEDQTLKELFNSTQAHLMGLARLLLRLMAESKESLGQKELREFTKHFKFVRRIFPFI